MTSHSDRFENGEKVWEAWAWMGLDGKPGWKIRRATFSRSEGGYELLHYEDGRVDHYWPVTDRKAFRHHVEAVAHVVSVLQRIVKACNYQIHEVLSQGDPASGGMAPAGIAQPEVAK
jgi:hypothetical protein